MFSLCRRALIDTGLNNIGSSRLICQLPPRTFQANSTDEKQQTRTRFLPFHITCGHGSSNFGIQFVQFSRHKSTTTTMPLDFTVAKSQFVANLKDIHLADAKDAPAPIFWSGMLGLVPIVLPPLSFLLFGYSNSLATMQNNICRIYIIYWIFRQLNSQKFATQHYHQLSLNWVHSIAERSSQIRPNSSDLLGLSSANPGSLGPDLQLPVVRSGSPPISLLIIIPPPPSRPPRPPLNIPPRGSDVDSSILIGLFFITYEQNRLKVSSWLGQDRAFSKGWAASSSTMPARGRKKKSFWPKSSTEKPRYIIKAEVAALHDRISKSTDHSEFSEKINCLEQLISVIDKEKTEKSAKVDELEAELEESRLEEMTEVATQTMVDHDVIRINDDDPDSRRLEEFDKLQTELERLRILEISRCKEIMDLKASFQSKPLRSAQSIANLKAQLIEQQTTLEQVKTRTAQIVTNIAKELRPQKSFECTARNCRCSLRFILPVEFAASHVHGVVPQEDIVVAEVLQLRIELHDEI
ncbi:unnamed protein product [Nesidiocoris tenuis]|uniref:Uncharacterized protein n=1 Tax=Nesidiocoris tenuis TaxID=355587 RepID=A0A6H5GD57_9HEMI|nr:unnamed protein product [Nesidiocoris tenuis]